MYQHESGYYVPSAEYGRKYLEGLMDDNLPSHNWQHVQACLRACKDSMKVAIDVGAYIGTWTVHLAQHFDYVYAFEPVPENFNCLRKNVNGKSVASLKIALHSEATHLMMRQYKPHHPYTWSIGSYGEEHEIKTAAVPLDNMPLQELDLLKINASGHELDIILGAKNTILKHRPSVIVSENYDPHRRACAQLTKWGMKNVWQNERLYLFTWK